MIIFVLDPLPLVSEMFVMLIHRVQPQTRVFTANSFRQFNGLINKYEAPDFIIIDPYCMEFLGEIVLKHASERLPNSKIIITTTNDIKLNFESYEAHGDNKLHHIDKKNTVDQIIEKLSKILKNTQSENLETINSTEIIKLSKRHKQLINFLDQGYSNQQIAGELNISIQTVKVHFFRLYKLLGTNNRLKTLHLAKTNGWIVNNF
jgi:DNA-binding NarL/FixJ family response regulator